MNIATPRFLDALQFAVVTHACDQRKGSGVPYVSHLLQVCGLVLMDGGNEEEAIAALLHDCLEDHGDTVSFDSLRARFGEEVAAIVRACTDTPASYEGGEKPPWRARKEQYLQHLKLASPSAVRVSISDKVDNIRAIVADYRLVGEALWSRFKAGREGQRWYFHSLLKVFEKSSASAFLVQELRAGVLSLEQQFQSNGEA
jgi:GTP pyrophosphokinase